MKRAAIIILAFVQACSTPAVHDRVVEVDKPVSVHPIDASQVPTVPAPLGKRPPTMRQQEDALLSKVCEFVAYALKTDPLLRASAGMQQQPLAPFPQCEHH